MATPGCTQQDLLTIFADNTTQNITPADLRQLVNCLYGGFLEISEVIDNLDTYDSLQALSANQGALIGDKLEDQDNRISIVETTKADANLVYTKGESDSRYYTQTQIDSGIYKKNEVYTKQEVDNAIYSLQQEMIALSARIDCIVQKLNINC